MAGISPINGQPLNQDARTGHTGEEEPAISWSHQERRIAAERARGRSCFHCALRRSCFPDHLNEETFTEIDRIAHGRGPVARGETIFNAGDPFENVYTVRSGTLRISTIDHNGAEQVIGFTLPGEITGIESLGSEGDCTRAVTLERTTLCAIPVDRLLAIAQSHPGLQRRVHQLAGGIIRRDRVHFRELAGSTRINTCCCSPRTRSGGTEQPRSPPMRSISPCTGTISPITSA